MPVIDYVYAAKWENVSDPFEPREGMDIVVTNLDVGLQSFALIIAGESMLPKFQQGDMIIIDPGVMPMPGDFVFAKLEIQDEGTFKKYRPRGTDKNGQPVIELVPLNEDWPKQIINANNPGHIIGTLVEHRHYWRRKSG